TVKEEIEEEESKTVYQLTAKEVLAAAITSGRFGLVFSGLVLLYTKFLSYVIKKLNVLPRLL
ncbi:hypothetical protein ACT4US_15425, partial [Bacillus sp. HC-Mk]